MFQGVEWGEKRDKKMFFRDVSEAPPDPIFGLIQAFQSDTRQEKINLAIGIFTDDHLKADLFPSARQAKNNIIPQDLMADYLPIDGMSEMTHALGELVFGEKEWQAHHSRIYPVHTPGGSSALRVGAELIVQEVSKSFYIPNPTWANHRNIFERAHCVVETYPYYNKEKKGFDFEAMVAFLKKLPEKSVVLLHACCHNPTGCDPTAEEWKTIAKVMKSHKLFPFFDFAYQGLGDGVEKDAASIRLFLEEGLEMAIAYSCSKNFSLYCQRVGALFFVTENSAVKLRVATQVKRIIRSLYSNPPAHGARIVVEILKRDDLKKAWQKDLEAVRRRIHLMRETLIQRLISKAKGIDFEYLKKHKGMFSFIDMDKMQVKRMIEEFAIYMTDNGRISIPGLTTKNIDYVVNSLVSVCAKR